MDNCSFHTLLQIYRLFFYLQAFFLPLRRELAVEGAGELTEVAALRVAAGVEALGHGTGMMGGVVGGAAGDIDAELRIEN